MKTYLEKRGLSWRPFGVKLYFCYVPEVLYCVTIEEWKGFVCVFGNHN